MEFILMRYCVLSFLSFYLHFCKGHRAIGNKASYALNFLTKVQCHVC